MSLTSPDRALAELPLTGADTLDAPTPPAPARAGLLLGLSLVLVAFNLRIPISSLGPVLPEAVRATGLGLAGASLLTMLPTLCFGIFGSLAPRLTSGLGTERALLAMLAATALGTGLRALGGAPGLFAGQVLACAGIAVVNVLLPGLVKRDFPVHVARMTGLYVMSMCVGAALGAGATVPLEHATGSWAVALALWAVPGAAAVAIWLPRAGRGATAGAARRHVRGLWSDRLAWQVTLFMGLQSSLAYIVFGWLAPILRDRGLTPVQAGLALSLSVVGQAVASLVAPMLATLGRDQRPAVAVVCLVGLGSMLACIYAPLGQVWLWSVLLGLAQGGMFALALTLIVLRSPDAHVAAHLSGMAQGVGYILASAGPLLVGLLHGWTGGWGGLAALTVILGAAMTAAGLGAGRARFVDAVLHP